MHAPQSAIERLKETEKHIRDRVHLVPRVGLILGSGLGAAVDADLSACASFPFPELPHFARSTVDGHAGKLILGDFAGVPVAVMQGRLHFYEGHSLEEVVYPVRLMKLLGIEHLIVTAAAGSMNAKFGPGTVVVLKDHLNFMGENCLRGPHCPQFGERFPDMCDIYPEDLRKIALAEARECGLRAVQGIYVAVPGPSYETPAEIRAFRRLGGDVIGMSTVPEAVAATQMGVKVLGISYVANYAAGMSGGKLSHREVLEAGKAVTEGMARLIGRVTVRIGSPE